MEEHSIYIYIYLFIYLFIYLYVYTYLLNGDQHLDVLSHTHETNGTWNISQPDMGCNRLLDGWIDCY